MIIQRSNFPCPSPGVLSASQIALEECISRVEQVMKDHLADQSVSAIAQILRCPITLEIPKTPVVTQCGHLFDKIAIERLRNCPTCREHITQLSPVYAVSDLIAQMRKEDVLFQKHLERGQRVLTVAEQCVLEGDIPEALRFYKEAFQYLHTSAVYAEIPKMYRKLGRLEDATLSSFRLAALQLKERKISEAMNTLSSLGASFKKQPLFEALRIHASFLRGNSHEVEREWALQTALEQDNLEDRTFIYRQWIACYPNDLEVYQILIPLLKNPWLKKEMLVKAANVATSLGTVEVETSLCKEPHGFRMTPQVWSNVVDFGPSLYPKDLLEFFYEPSGSARPCTIFEGKTRLQTHIAFPLFSHVEIDGSYKPLTFSSLGDLHKTARGFSPYKYFWCGIPRKLEAPKEDGWAVMTNDVVPGTCGKSWEQQLSLIPQGYHPPSALLAATALLFAKNQSPENCYFSGGSLTYTRCIDEQRGVHVCIGASDDLVRLHIDIGHNGQMDSNGLACVRKFC